MYEPHAAREDTIIFPAFKKALGLVKRMTNSGINSKKSNARSSAVTVSTWRWTKSPTSNGHSNWIILPSLRLPSSAEMSTLSLGRRLG